MAIRITNKRQFKQGQSVAVHPATNAFMQGDRYGCIVDVSEAFIWVQMYRSARVRKFIPSDVLPQVK